MAFQEANVSLLSGLNRRIIGCFAKSRDKTGVIWKLSRFLRRLLKAFKAITLSGWPLRERVSAEAVGGLYNFSSHFRAGQSLQTLECKDSPRKRLFCRQAPVRLACDRLSDARTAADIYDDFSGFEFFFPN